MTTAAPRAAVGLATFWTETPEALCATLHCGTAGLTAGDAAVRLETYGPNSDAEVKHTSLLRAVAHRLLEPLSLILLAAGVVSIATGDAIGGLIIVTILALSIGLDTVQEGQAVKAADLLRRSVALKAEVKRDGVFSDIDVDKVVPGDILRIRSGDIIPADALILDSTAFVTGEAALTGEPYPVEKHAGRVTAKTAGEASNAVFRGAVAQGGEATALVVNTGKATVFGAAAAALAEVQTPSPFQRDLREYGLVTARLTMALVVIVLATRVFLGRPVLDSLLFAVALAVGLTPELLPMITTVTLSRGAMRMAKRKVIVKRLASIHDLGAMTVLCTDKTGTLTSAAITLAHSFDPTGSDDPRAAKLGAITAALSGDRGALDAALMQGSTTAASGWTLAGRRAFDFSRRLGSVLVTGPEGVLLIVKGAPEAVLAHCTATRNGTAIVPMGASERQGASDRVGTLAQDGLRSVAVASRVWSGPTREIEMSDESALVFEGLCAFADPPKPTAKAAIARLAAAGIRVKILSGDDPIVVKRLAGLVGLNAGAVLSGADIAAMSDEALAVQVRTVDAYGRLAPDQKSRIVKALQAGREIVGFLGDGINDAPALKLADIGLSVDGATGVAQAAADMILLDSDLAVVADGVEEGRRTFANILKYVRMGASSNFGNMLSMAVASVALPFLPMLPTQILLNNLIYDFSEIGIPFDGVRPEATAKPQVWDMKGIIRFAAVMGPLSSLFDFATFGLLIAVFHVAPEESRTTWFLESMITQILVIFIIRTNGRPWRSLPSPALAASSLLALLGAMLLPFTPAGAWFGFQLPPASVLAATGVIVVAYLVAAELLKPMAIGEVGRRLHSTSLRNQTPTVTPKTSSASTAA
ncbi:magnesium-translocating P-type ATPase [Lichenifustis flavocetrariae]|uniref:Magnesium-transporting ATPase, P-type 1 n=1 Tax=Lichenifustis flavocetrariae TaxID=2949735 RepID=A0AA42CI60_9HYPH|nr:magnesium-translocating P-type ATPase [Lichenifustis flavocetrariae]MCW6508253.1 magnesium-translocating P-type ATPase [Lichenifustis flavocetrariae]